MALSPCSSCSRHCRIDDAVCPFCGGAPLPLPSPRAVRGAGRAALLLGASLAASACGGSSTPEGERGSSGGESASADPTAPTQPTAPPVQPGGPPEDDGGGVVALYGAPSE